MRDYRPPAWLVFFVPALIIALAFIAGFQQDASAKIEWEILNKITLDESPKDVAVSNDGTTAYILGSRNILIYSMQDNKITDTIPITDQFSQLVMASDGERLFLTDSKSKQVSIIRLSPIYEIEIGQSPVIGKKDAPVHVAAFIDYQCPYCAKVYPVLEQLLEKYPTQVNLILKHYPLKMHRFARIASLAALAAARQDKYAEVTRAFFKNYSGLNEQTVKKYAEEAGVKDLEAALNDPSLQNIISQDVAVGAKVKVRGVPALFVNGRVVKNRSLAGLSQMVENELKKQ
ncbi:MAG: thioredoxin domain-containing protein [bacterium]